MSSIYGVHDEAKDKAFELELSWVCDESNRQHEKVITGLVCQVSVANFYVLLQLFLSSPRNVYISYTDQVPENLLEEAKAAAKAALEEMDAD